MRCRIPFLDPSRGATTIVASAAKQSRVPCETSPRWPRLASPEARNSGAGRASIVRTSPPRLAAVCLAAALALPAGGCTGGATGTAPPPSTGTLRERIAALALRQVDFGVVSIIPVRFEKSRISGPFEDGGRTLYCVTSHMKGRTFGKAERPKAVIRDEGGVLKIIRDEEEVCEGHRTEPFQELDSTPA